MRHCLFKIQEGKYHGHSSLQRGATEPNRFVLDGAGCFEPLLSNLKPSSNGGPEYRSNLC